MSYRVTNSMMQNLMLNDMHTNLSKLLDIQQQLSTQRKYQSATENPNAVTKGMNLETMMVETSQYKDNLDDAVSWLKFTDTALGEMNDIFHRIRELAIYAGDGVLEGVDLEAIAVELKELKAQVVSLANSTIAGEYLFAGLLTQTTPFTVGENGDVIYNGNDYAVKWEFSRQEVGKVSVTGSELFPKTETTNILKGVELPLDFEWTGRNEILEFKVGWQTVKVRIPERWNDETVNGLDDYGDYNRYRDFGELEGWSLKEIADMINESIEMGDVSKILKAEVISDLDRGVQYLQIKSHTGEPVRLTSWPETDPVWVPQGIKGAAYGPADRTADADGVLTIKFSDEVRYDVDISTGDTLSDIAGKLNALPDGRLWAAVKTDNGEQWLDIVSRDTTEDAYFNIETTGGAVSLFTPQLVKATSHKEADSQVLKSNAFDVASFKTYASGEITIVYDGHAYTAAIAKDSDLDAIKTALEGAQDIDGNAIPAAAGISFDIANGKIVIASNADPNATFDVYARGGATALYSDGAFALSSSTTDANGKYTLETYHTPSDLEITAENGGLYLEVGGIRYTVEVKKGAKLADVRDEINKIAGVTSEVMEDVDSDGNTTQYLRIKGSDKMQISGFGAGGAIVGAFFVGSKEIQTNNDHTHIGFAELMGMETSIKSTELKGDGLLGDTTGAPLHIKFVGGSNHGEVYIADDKDLTIEELANRINSVCGTWLQAVVETDEPDGTDTFYDPLTNSEDNREDATKRLVLRTINGEPFAIYDGPGMETAKGSGKYAQMLGISTALMGVSTLSKDQARNVLYPETGTDSFFDENMPAILNVTVGDRSFDVKVCKNNRYTAHLVAQEIVRSVNEQYGGTLLAWDENDVANATDTTTFALYSLTGEPLRVVDKGYGDPRYSDFSGGVAMQLGIAAGLTSVASDDITDETNDFGPGTIRISTLGHTVDVPVLTDDTLQSLSIRIKEYAGDWLDVSFYDSTIGSTADGGKVRMSLAAKDGSAVSVLDIGYAGDADTPGANNVAHRLGLDTGLTGTEDLSGGVGGNFPTFEKGDMLTIKVNGAVHTIDLWDREIDRPVAESVEDMAAEINARFQGKDIVADVHEDGGKKYLTLTSPWGYGFEVSSEGPTDAAATFGFGAGNAATRGYDPDDLTSAGDLTGANYNQIVVRRTGNNQKDTDFFGVVDNLVDCVLGGHVDGISDTMLSQLDTWLNNLLKCRAQVGALQSRYQTASYRMTSNNTNYTSVYTSTVGVDLAEVITNYEMASNIYEASLAAISRIMTPTLLDFLR